MKITVWQILSVFILVTALHISAILFGWYETEIVWIDNMQHILAGIAFAMLFLMIHQKPKSKKKIAIYIILFVLVTSIIWELFEFTLLMFIPLYAIKFSLYSPNIIESLEDIISNLIGGVLFSIYYLQR